MAIIAPQTAPNWSIGNYWKILKAEFTCAPQMVETDPPPRLAIMLGFYASDEARKASPDKPMWTHTVFVSLEQMIERDGCDPRDWMYHHIMLDPAFAGTNAAPDTDDATTETSSA